MKKRHIEKRIRMMEKHLANAEEYVAQNVNVKGVSFLHFDDWRGKSGHPAWMKNFMIPTTKIAIAKNERVLETIDKKNKDRGIEKRKRRAKS
jgi:hypothetical protein